MRAQLTYLTLAMLPLGLVAGVAGPSFSGVWILDAQRSHLTGLGARPAAELKIGRQGDTFECTESGVTRSFTPGEGEVQWDGDALRIGTPAGEDRWELSKDGKVLTISRTIRREGAATVATLVYRNQNDPEPLTPVVVEAGTRIPLSLINSINTKRSAEGDRIYLETAFPVARSGRIVIPKGSYVAGTVTEVKRAGKMKGKSELYLRFDSLTLPNGVTRDFRARLDQAGASHVDRKEGKITGDTDRSGDVRKVGEAAGAGASVGGIAGSVAGHAGMGTGIGAIAGAAAGLMAVLSTRGPELILAKGTTLEMVLDRDLTYDPRELPVAAVRR